jgi:hypothetical protein
LRRSGFMLPSLFSAVAKPGGGSIAPNCIIATYLKN